MCLGTMRSNCRPISHPKKWPGSRSGRQPAPTTMALSECEPVVVASTVIHSLHPPVPFPNPVAVCLLRFCLDERKALERDCGFSRLQSRLIRFETQTTCCKQPCPVPLALSPMPAPTPSPSEPGYVPDGEAAQNEPLRLKHRFHEPDAATQQQKRSAFSAWSTFLKDEMTTELTSLIMHWTIMWGISFKQIYFFYL